MNGVLEGSEKVVPLGIRECWFGLVLNDVSLMNGELDQGHLTGWQFISILLGSSPGCHPLMRCTLTAKP